MYFIFLEYTKTHFDLVGSKIGAKLDNLVIYDDIFVTFLRTLTTKSTIYQILKIAKMGKLLFHRLTRNIVNQK